MAITDSIASASPAITGGVKTLTSLLNLAPGPTAVAGFVADGIFKAIKLGADIRAKQREESAKLDAKIRAQDVLRTPIVVDLTALGLRRFYGNAVNLITFPGLGEFAREIDEFKKTGGNPSVETQRVLGVAKWVVPALQNDPTLAEHAELAELFATSLDPVRPGPRAFVRAYLALFPEGKLSYSEQYERLGSYWKTQLMISLGDIDQKTLDAQTALNEAVRGLVTAALFDSATGAVGQALGLAKTLKKTAIDEQIAALTANKNKETDAALKLKIQGEIDGLTAWKGRLA